MIAFNFFMFREKQALGLNQSFSNSWPSLIRGEVGTGSITG